MSAAAAEFRGPRVSSVEINAVVMVDIPAAAAVETDEIEAASCHYFYLWVVDSVVQSLIMFNSIHACSFFHIQVQVFSQLFKSRRERSNVEDGFRSARRSL